MKILSRSSHNVSRRKIDEDALKVMYRLNRKGFKAYLVGGAVRDILLGKTPKDYDIATDARPGQVKKIFSNSFLIGRRFKLAHIRFKGDKIIEVATFRREAKEGSDEDVHNTFGTPEEDAYRRDITINALFYNIADFTLIDYVGGLEDIEKGIIRVIGEPGAKFKEDPVRILRVVRHSSRLNFKIHNETASEMFQKRHLLESCSGARMYEEICKDMKSGHLMPVMSQYDLFGLLPYVFGHIGRYYVDNPKRYLELLRCLKTIDCMSSDDNPLPIEDIFSILLWPWARDLLEICRESNDKTKVLHDGIIDAELKIQIPKAIINHTVHVMLMLNKMEKAVKTGHFRYSEKKKMHYNNASKVFGILKGKFIDNSDPFDGFLKNQMNRNRRYQKRIIKKQVS